MSAAADPIDGIINPDPDPLSTLAAILQAPESAPAAEPSPAAAPSDADVRTNFAHNITPPVPETLEETGIPPSVIEQLVLKYLYFRGEMLGREIAATLGLKFSLIDELLETLKRQHYVGVKKSLGMGNSSGVFQLTETGRNLTREYLESNLYSGPAPVPLYQYTEVVKRQKLREDWLNPASLKEAFKHLVVESDVLAQIGPAVNASKSFLIYGQPGNGKTALAEALFHVDTDPIYLPYAIECQGNIIQLYDPIYHQKIEDQEMEFSAAISLQLPYDGRWFKCKRPFIITGGELTLEMLDLSYNKVSKVYDAPFQLKANNGIYLLTTSGGRSARRRRFSTAGSCRWSATPTI